MTLPALHSAVSDGRDQQLKELIESGDSVNLMARDNITPLHLACKRSHPNCARLLLEAGARVRSINMDLLPSL